MPYQLNTELYIWDKHCNTNKCHITKNHVRFPVKMFLGDSKLTQYK